MNKYIDILKYKLFGLFNKRIAFSSLIFDSVIDKSASIRQNVRLYHVKIRRYSYVGRNSLIQHTEIGAFCSISEDCIIGLPSHPTNYISTSPVFLSGSNYLFKNFSRIPYNDCPKTIIENDVWIGTRAQIKSGLKIGNGSVIGAGAIVTSDVPPYAIVGGVPAKIIRYRFEEELIEQLIKSCWWDWTEDKIMRNIDGFRDISVFQENNKL